VSCDCVVADAQTHAHDLENAITLFQVTGRIEIARAWKIDIDDFLKVANAMMNQGLA
jgi:hypothetical protein